MKKIFAALCVITIAFAVTSCAGTDRKSEGVMTYAEFDAAPLDSEVTIEAYVQAHQDWWDNKITVYAADKEGAYFLYEMVCTEEDAAKLTPGTKFKAKGFKSEWSGEVEIVDATFELEDGNYIAPVEDVTSLLGTDELKKHQNCHVLFKDMTVSSVAYKNDEPGDDIYVTFSKDGKDYDFCLEYYLNGSDSALYDKVGSLTEGQVCDVEGFLYWYEGPNTHITSVTVK